MRWLYRLKKNTQHAQNNVKGGFLMVLEHLSFLHFHMEIGLFSAAKHGLKDMWLFSLGMGIGSKQTISTKLMANI